MSKLTIVHPQPAAVPGGLDVKQASLPIEHRTDRPQICLCDEVSERLKAKEMPEDIAGSIVSILHEFDAVDELARDLLTASIVGLATNDFSRLATAVANWSATAEIHSDRAFVNMLEERTRIAEDQPQEAVGWDESLNTK